MGRTFTVENNHQPLETIALKNLMAAPPRLQRMLLRLQPFDCTIKYWPGPEMLLVDALSRLPSPTNHTIELDMKIEHHRFTTQSLQQIATETEEDPVLAVVYNLTLESMAQQEKHGTTKSTKILASERWTQHRPWNPTERTLHSLPWQPMGKDTD